MVSATGVTSVDSTPVIDLIDSIRPGGCASSRAANTGDEPPENRKGTWRYPTLVGWEGYPAALRDKLSGADFGSATIGIKDSTFNSHLAEAKPADIPFDPNA